ncbi:MAG TPA: molecular chaperone HtpG, partial [Candidatus Marinimicrobia bacterium]|nr:molecular chaperone HtpG [Candidatus Neomarinimicrobiota bacterium]
EYMRFVKGIVDSEDLPLNISRETLQDNRIVGKLGKFLTKRIISFLQDKAKDDPEKYLEFYKKFHMFLKEGANSDWENKEELAKLLRFESTKTEKDKLTTLDEYISRMEKEQNEIYYLSGTSRASLENSPYLETFKSNDVEVLFLYEAIDDFVMTSLREFSGKKLVSADQSKLKMKSKKKDKTEKSEKATEKEVKKLAKWIKESNEAKLEDVILSERLVDSPAILVNSDDMMTTQMQKILQSAKGEMYSVGKKILEINPHHELIQELARKKSNNADDSELSEYIQQMIDNAYMMAGLAVDQNEFVKRAYRIMAKALK